MECDDFIIRNAVIHILDSVVGLPVLSDSYLELSSDLCDFLRNHIYKIASSDDLKNCQFQENSSVLPLFQAFNEDNLLLFSKELASFLYTIMNQNINIAAADLFVVTYQYQSDIYLALLKMNYKEFYVHCTNPTEDKNCNDIIKQTAALPSSASRLSEAALIRISDLAIHLIERKYEINGTKTNYFSELFLQCYTKMSSKAKLNIVAKTVEQINKKYYEDNIDKQLEAKSIIHNDIIEQGTIIPETIGEKLYGDIPEIKEEFTEKLQKYNLVTEEVKPQNKTTTKKFEKQFLTTDSGIEIKIPMEEYDNKENVEFITNPDGTISVLIKNIHQLTSK